MVNNRVQVKIFMSSNLTNNSNSFSESDWTTLYRVGGLSALVIVLFIPLQIIIFILYPPPTTVLDWFNLFQKNRIIGLLDMDLLLIIDQLLFGLIILALYVKLKHTDQSLMLIALVIGFMGIITYFSSTVAFDMLSLSDKYAAASTEAEKTALLTVGQAMVITWTGTAFDIGYILLGVSFLIIGYVMLRSAEFNKSISYAGIVTGIFSLIPASFGIIGLIFAFVSLLPMEIWLILLTRKLLFLSSNHI